MTSDCKSTFCATLAWAQPIRALSVLYKLHQYLPTCTSCLFRLFCAICVVSLRQRTTFRLSHWILTQAPRIGDAAKNAFATNPENTVFDAKRLIGRKIDDPEIKKDMKHWPFKVIEKNGKPYIRVKHRGDQKDFVRLCC